MFLCWTPDGRHLTFAYSMEGDPSIFWTAVEGSGPAEPESLVTSEYMLQPSCWSPDGRRLFFVESNPVSGSDIWIYDREERRKEPVLNTNYSEQYPDISPDGQWLAYCSTETGQTEVYVASMSTPSQGTAITSTGGAAPLWAPDNRAIYYWNLDWSAIMAIDITLEPRIDIGVPCQLFELSTPSPKTSWVRGYDVSRDGTRFLIPGRGQTKPVEVTRLNLVQNWFEEIERRCPSDR